MDNQETGRVEAKTEAENIRQQAIDSYGDILPHTDPALSKACIPCDPAWLETGEVLRLILAMKMHLDNSQGIGLAANQVGGDRRVIVLRANEGYLYMVNPTITHRRGRIKLSEKCLSVESGNTAFAVKRSKRVTVEYMSFTPPNENNELSLEHKRLTVSGLGAVVVQHEIDHLNGINITQKGTRIAPENPSSVN